MFQLCPYISHNDNTICFPLLSCSRTCTHHATLEANQTQPSPDRPLGLEFPTNQMALVLQPHDARAYYERADQSGTSIGNDTFDEWLRICWRKQECGACLGTRDARCSWCPAVCLPTRPLSLCILRSLKSKSCF